MLTWTSLMVVFILSSFLLSLSLSITPSSSLSLLTISPQHLSLSLSLSLSLWPHILLLLSPHCSLPLFNSHQCICTVLRTLKLKDGQPAPVSLGGLGYFSANLLIAESETSPHLFSTSSSSSSLLHCLSSVTRPLCADGCDALLKQCDLRARPSVSAGAAGRRSLTAHRLVW